MRQMETHLEGKLKLAEVDFFLIFFFWEGGGGGGEALGGEGRTGGRGQLSWVGRSYRVRFRGEGGGGDLWPRPVV